MKFCELGKFPKKLQTFLIPKCLCKQNHDCHIASKLLQDMSKIQKRLVIKVSGLSSECQITGANTYKKPPYVES